MSDDGRMSSKESKFVKYKVFFTFLAKMSVCGRKSVFEQFSVLLPRLSLFAQSAAHSLTLSRQAKRPKGDFAPVRKGARGAGGVTYGELMEGGDSLCVHYSSINDLRKESPDTSP